MKSIGIVLLLATTALGQGVFYAGSDPHLAHAVHTFNLSLADKPETLNRVTFENFHKLKPVKYSMCKASKSRTFRSSRDESKRFDAVVLGVDSKNQKVRMKRKGKKAFVTSWKYFTEADRTWFMAYSVSQLKRIEFEKRKK